MENIRDCHCCGQPRPYPREPGKWEYLESPTMTREDGSTYHKWQRVNVIAHNDDYEGPSLRIIPEGETEPIWWPSNCAWRKVE